jgi:hypothetical protein
MRLSWQSINVSKDFMVGLPSNPAEKDWAKEFYTSKFVL